MTTSSGVEGTRVGAGRKAAGRRLAIPVLRTGTAVVAILALVVAALGAATVRLWLERGDLNAVQAAVGEAGPAATQAAQDMSSYDYRTLDSDLRTATGHTTGKFRKEFEAQTARVKSIAPQQQAMVTGQVQKMGIEKASPDRVIALVFLNQQTVKATDVAKGDRAQRLPSQFTLRMTMQKVDGRWLVADLDVL